MSQISFVALTCLTCWATGQCVQTLPALLPSRPLAEDVEASSHTRLAHAARNPLATLATLLLAFNPGPGPRPLQSAAGHMLQNGQDLKRGRTMSMMPLVLHDRRACSTPTMVDDFVTLAEVKDAARKLGCELKVNAVGPAYRIELFWERGKELPSPPVLYLGWNDDEPPPADLLGVSDGATQPNGITHLETIEVRKFTGFFARRKEQGAKRYNEANKLKPGLLISTATACWIKENGPFQNTKGQLLCIRDDERQHRKLVQYYRRLGFGTLREVDEGLKSLADRLFWGGTGTLMEMGVDEALTRFTPKIRQILQQ